MMANRRCWPCSDGWQGAEPHAWLRLLLPLGSPAVEGVAAMPSTYRPSSPLWLPVTAHIHLDPVSLRVQWLVSGHYLAPRLAQ
jgi:hypothetical protein